MKLKGWKKVPSGAPGWRPAAFISLRDPFRGLVGALGARAAALPVGGGEPRHVGAHAIDGAACGLSAARGRAEGEDSEGQTQAPGAVRLIPLC